MKKKASLLILMGLMLSLTISSFALAESTLQQRIDAAPEHGIIELQAGQTYAGNLTITKPITIIGAEGTTIKGDGTGNVIEVKASDVHLEGFKVTGSSLSRNTGEEYAAIKLFEGNNTIANIVVDNSFHGIYLSQSHHNFIQNVQITGQANGTIAGQGNGIQLYYSNHNTLEDNTIKGTRDGIFFDYSNDNIVTGHEISKTRYGLHFMYSNQNDFSNNAFHFNTAGAAIMFSFENRLSDNEFSFNQGSRSFGLLLQSSDDNQIKNNLFYQNLRGIYLDQSHDNDFENNDLMQNRVGVELWSSSSGQSFTKNRFHRNDVPVLTLGGRSQNDWSVDEVGNDWGTSFPLLDLDRNGIGDAAVTSTSSLYRLVEESELAYLFLNRPAMNVYEIIYDVIGRDRIMFVDDYPLVRPAERFSSVFSLAAGSAASILIVWFTFKKRRSEK